MPTYYATIRHHSIAQAREIVVVGTLAQAKRKATREFGDGFVDHEIVIGRAGGDIVSRRRIAERGWSDAT